MSIILERLRWIIAGLNRPAPVTPKRLNNTEARPTSLPPSSQKQQSQPMKSNSNSLSNHRNSQSMLDAVYEIAIYIHRFHNLDLFQQGYVSCNFLTAVPYLFLSCHIENHSCVLFFLWHICRWYQIKITMRWEDGNYDSVGTPSRVVQYEGNSSIHIRMTLVN